MRSDSLQLSAKTFVKHLLIRTGLETIALCDAGRLFPAAAGRGVIFTLHHVRPARNHDYEPNAHLSITPEFLDEAIVTGRQLGLHAVHLEELPGLLGNSSDIRKFMCFTLDDGLRDNREYAAPVFHRHGVPYTIFIAPGLVERTRTMWWETAEELTRSASCFAFDFGGGTENVRCASRPEKLAAFARLEEFVQATDEDEAVARIDLAANMAGVDPKLIVDREIMTADELRDLVKDPLARLGAHSITHPNLARVTEKRLRQELEFSAARVAEYSGQRPKTFAYPYGGPHAVGPREVDAAAKAGFTLAVTTRPGVLSSMSMKKLTDLARVSLNGNYQRARYVKALASGLPFRFM